MRIQKFSDTAAFVAIDLADAPATGIVRLAPKILQGGAKDLARSLTYSHGLLGQQVSGASAGINAAPEDREAALAAFTAELAAQEPRWFHADPGKGVASGDLAPLHAGDPRHPGLVGVAQQVRTAGIVAAVDHVVTDLASATISCDVSWADDLLDTLREAGATIVDGDDAYAAEVDVVLTGAKVGAIDHNVAPRVVAKAVVPIAPLPITARAFAILRSADVTVLPDFLTLAAEPAAAFAPHDVEPGELVHLGAAAVSELLGEVSDHPDGPYLGACYRAEEFLATWQDQLPFGRPFAP